MIRHPEQEEGDETPGPSPSRSLRSRLRFKIGTMMILIAIAALAIQGYLMKRRWDAAVLEHARAADRLRWSEAMHKKGYASRSQLLSDRSRYERAKQRLGYQAGGRGFSQLSSEPP